MVYTLRFENFMGAAGRRIPVYAFPNTHLEWSMQYQLLWRFGSSHDVLSANYKQNFAIGAPITNMKESSFGKYKVIQQGTNENR
jgi:hypothetical protein